MEYIIHMDILLKQKIKVSFSLLILVIISFRGTQLTSIQNWWSNILFFPVSKFCNETKGARAHKGFVKSSRSLMPKIFDVLSKLSKDKKIVTIGYSRGGALANLVACHLGRNGYSSRVELLTFASPRVGNQPFIEHCSKVRIHTITF